MSRCKLDIIGLQTNRLSRYLYWQQLVQTFINTTYHICFHNVQPPLPAKGGPVQVHPPALQGVHFKKSFALIVCTQVKLCCARLKSSFTLLLVVYFSHFDAVIVKIFLKGQHTKCHLQQRDQIEGEVEANVRKQQSS